METMIGLLLAFLGGGIQGTFVYPLKLMKTWECIKERGGI